jgi:hypothetical protein
MALPRRSLVMTPARHRPPGVIAVVLAVLLAAPVSAQRSAPTFPQVQAASVVPEYAAVLQALDPAKPESIIQARDAAAARYTKASSAEADAVFRQFQAFYDKVLWTTPFIQLRTPLNDLLTDVCRKEGLKCRAAAADAFLASTSPMDARRRDASRPAVAELARFRACGIWFSYGEGDWYAAPDPTFVTDIAGRLPLGELAEWVTFWAAETPQRIADDASLVIGWDDLRQRIARWETFGRAHPELPETQVEVLPHVANLVAIYVFGIDNSRAYDERFGTTPSYDVRVGAAPPNDPRAGRARDWTIRVDPQLKASYDRFLVKNRDSAYYRVIDGIVTRLQTSGGAPTRELVDFLEAELTDPYFTDWLRRAELWLTGRLN